MDMKFTSSDAGIAEPTQTAGIYLKGRSGNAKSIPSNPLIARYTSGWQRGILAGNRQDVHVLAVITRHAAAVRQLLTGSARRSTLDTFEYLGDVKLVEKRNRQLELDSSMTIVVRVD